MVTRKVVLVVACGMVGMVNMCAFSHQKETPMKTSEFSFILKPSDTPGVEGIGVFAVHDIPAGTRLFGYLKEGHKIRIAKIKDVPTPFLQYCIYINDEECICPERFDRMEIGWYLNHSSTPNVGHGEVDIQGNVVTSHLYASKDIKAGEELVMNYNDLNEPENLKEDFYKEVVNDRVAYFKRCLLEIYEIDAEGVQAIVDKVRNFLQGQASDKIISEFLRISTSLDLSHPKEPYVLPASDGVLVAPEFHQILFEDARIRVLWGYVPAGAYVPFHTHSWRTVVIDWTPCSVKVDYADGTTRREEYPAGTSQYPPDVQGIAYTNLGPDCYCLEFEIKG